MCEDQRLTSEYFSSAFLYLMTKQLEPEAYHFRPSGHQDPRSLLYRPWAMRLQVFTTVPDFSMASEDSKSSLHSCTVSAYALNHLPSPETTF